MQRSWKDLVAEIVDQLPSHFELRDVLKYEPELERHYPNNSTSARRLGKRCRFFATKMCSRSKGVADIQRHEPQNRGFRR